MRNYNKLFSDILNIQSYTHKTERMAEYIKAKCIDIGCYVYEDNGNLYAIKGDADSYPCIVAHTDTVHDIIRGYKVITDDHIAMAYDVINNRPAGIGGDDKVGIYIALQCLTDLPTCKAAFFRDEEIGCEGSYLADLDFFNDCRFVLQCDRKGNSDFVNNIMGTELYGKGFKKAVSPILKKYGYKESDGGMTDVYQLKENGLGIAVANMSCGYYNPHTDNEMINFEDVRNCLNMVKDIMGIEKTFKHTDKGYKWEYPWWGKDKEIYDQCWDCGGYVERGRIADYGLCKDCLKIHTPF